jgi:ATP-dependent phosphofructokinase / diphosphate-dependent phosphofructokinase
VAKELRGNLVVGQSGGCTAVINSSLVGVIDEAKKHPEIEGIYGSRFGIKGLLEDDLVDLGLVAESTLQQIRRTPSAALGSTRHKLGERESWRALEVLKAHNVRFLTYIGGNDSADTSHRLAQLAEREDYPLRVIAVPKTIDNDLPVTDHCPGYGSIARFVALATMDAGRDTEAMQHVDPIKIVEVMGRDAGWVAAATSLGKRSEEDAPHLIYFPERTFYPDRFLEELQAVYRKIGFAVVVVSETIRDDRGRHVGTVQSQLYTDAFGHRRVSGTASYLCDLITDRLRLKARFDKPGTIQRMSITCASEVDLEEAYQVGRAAVARATEGETDQLVVIVASREDGYQSSTGLAPLEAIANVQRPLPADFINEAGNFVTPAFRDYAGPLIGGPLPNYARLKAEPVSQEPRH